MRFNYLFFLLFSLFFLGFVSSSTQYYYTDANLPSEIILTENIVFPHNDNTIYYYFEDTNLDDDVNNIVIDCNNYSILGNDNNFGILFQSISDVNSITLKNCDANLPYSGNLGENEYTNMLIFIDNSDIDYIFIEDSNLYFGEDGYFINDQTDNFLKINFENVNSEKISFYDFNLDLNFNLVSDINFDDYNYFDTNFLNNSFISIDSESNIESILFDDSNVSIEDGFLFYILQDNINLDAINTDFNLSRSDVSGLFTGLVSGDINSITISDYNVLGHVLFYLNNVNYLNIFDSNFYLDDSYFYIGFEQSGNLDMNFYNSNITIGYIEDSNENTFLYILDGDYNNFEISNLNISTDVNYYNFLQAYPLDINNFIITDSVIELSNFIDVADANISGDIYNNIFTNFDPDSNYFDSMVSTIDLNFNITLAEDYEKRDSLFATLSSLVDVNLIDDSNWIGGNLWFDVNEDIYCSGDNYSPKGICDTSIMISGWDNNIFVNNYYYDYYPLTIDYILPDLNVYTYTKDSNGLDDIFITTGDYVDINFYFINSGLEDANDVNGLLYISILDGEGELTFLDSFFSGFINLSSGEGSYFNYYHYLDSNIGFDVNDSRPGYYDLNFILLKNNEDCNYLVDENCLNNYLFVENAFAIYEDENYVLEVQSLDSNQDYVGTVEFDCNIMNLGLNTSDRDYNVFFWYDYNSSTDSYESYYLQEFLSTDTIDSFSIKTVSFEHLVEEEGTYRFSCSVRDDRYIEDEQLEYYIEKTFTSLNTIDLIVESIDFSGALTDYTAKTIDCNIGNIGLENATEDYNVLFYVNDVLIDSNNIFDGLNVNNYNNVSFSWTPSSNATYTFKCLADYSGYDSNSDNNYLTTTATINYTAPSNPPGGPGGPSSSSSYDLRAILSLSDTTLSKDSSILLTSGISNLNSDDLDSAEYQIYFYSDDEKIILYEDDFSESNLPLSVERELSLNNLLEYGSILDLVDSEGKIKLYLEIEADDDDSYSNNISTKIITIEYLEANIKQIYLNDELLENKINFNLSENYEIFFDLEYLAINSDKDIVLNVKSNQRSLYYKNLSSFNIVDNNIFSDSIEISLLDFVSESQAKQLILDLYGFDLNNSIHRSKYLEILSNLGIEFDGVSFASNDYYLEFNLVGQDYFDSAKLNINIDFYVDTKYNVDSDYKDIKTTSENNEKEIEKIIYYLKYKSKLGLDENQIITIYDDKNNFISNEDLIIDFNENLFYFKTNNFGQVIYSPENIGDYNIFVNSLGLKGSFKVLKDYKSSNLDYIVFENSVLQGESKNTNYLFYLIPIIAILVLIIILLYFFYPRKPKLETYDFTSTENYPKSEFFEKEQLEKDIKLAKREERILEKKFVKKEIEFAKREESILEKKVVKKELKFAYKKDRVLGNKLKKKTGYDF